jgi:heme A synthase
VVVFKDLQPWLVVVHLGLAMIILGLLIATALMSFGEVSATVINPPRMQWAAVGATYILLLTGSSVVASGADERCHSWPLCGSGFTPSFDGVDAVTMLHRGVALTVGLLLAYAVLNLIRTGKREIRVAAWLTAVALVAQVLVGAASAIAAGALADGVHVALATAVFAGILTCALLTLPRHDREPATSLVMKGRTA